MLLKIVTPLFPENLALDDFQGADMNENIHLRTDKELTRAYAQLGNNKAPGWYSEHCVEDSNTGKT